MPRCRAAAREDSGPYCVPTREETPVPTNPTTSVVPLDLSLSTPDGASVSLGEVLTRPLTVVQLVRYFGCLPCQEWLINLDRVAGELARKEVGAIAIGGSAGYQAVWLREERGV